MTDEIEGTAEPIGSELIPQTYATLFRTEDPVQVLAEATRIANALKPVLVANGMTMRIGSNEHVKVEGWQTLGAMLGVVPVNVWTRKIEHGWEARTEARTLDGRVVGAGEMECLDLETSWQDSDDYAIRSMAQTRATSKALSGPLRFVVTLAGYSATPAEEMPSGGFSGRPMASDAQVRFIETLVKQKKVTIPQLELILERLGIDEKVEPGWAKNLTGGKEGTASALITFLKENPIPDPDHPSDVPSDTGEFDEPKADEDQEPLPFDEEKS